MIEASRDSGQESTHRGALYGGAAALLVGIAVWWGVTETEADVLTLLSSADVQLRLAHGIPEVDSQGLRLTARDDMITAAIGQLDKVDLQQPDMAVAIEFRGFAHMLRGEFLDAAHCYERALGCADVQEGQRDVLAFNQARMLAKAGRPEQALQVFARHAVALDARYGHQRQLEEASILRDLGREDEALERLDQVLRDDAAVPMARLQAGWQYEASGHLAAAERAFDGVRDELQIADYYLALLKLRQGDVDSCCQFLERAIAARPAEVRQLLRSEAAAWSAVQGDPRFEELTRPIAASPGR